MKLHKPIIIFLCFLILPWVASWLWFHVFKEREWTVVPFISTCILTGVFLAIYFIAWATEIVDRLPTETKTK